MQIKPAMLLSQMQKETPLLYVLVGQEQYLLKESVDSIKAILKKSTSCDEKTLFIHSEKDWPLVLQEANSYSLFSEIVLLQVVYDKKSIHGLGEKVLSEYVKKANPRCFIILLAPHVPAKQLQWLSNEEKVLLITSYPLDSESMKRWIVSQFKKNFFEIAPQVTDLIHQHTQGNMLACAQVIEKIALSYAPHRTIQAQEVLEHLSDQCTNSLFELADACLLGQADKAIHIIRQAANNKTEATVVLWTLTQEVRNLLQLSFGIQKKMDFNILCKKLKIWPQRIKLYQIAHKRLANPLLKPLLGVCLAIELQIKGGANTQVWNALEKLSVSLATGTVL